MFRWFRRMKYRLAESFDNFITMRWLTRWLGSGGMASGFNGFLRSVRAGRLRNALLGLPAVLVLAFAGYLYAMQYAKERVAATQYFERAKAAIKAGDTQAAELCLRRVLQERSVLENDAQFSLAVLLEDAGQVERAEALFRRLAPDDRIGNPESHRRLAIMLSGQMTPQSSIEEIERIYWHLKAARDETSPQMALCWGRHYAIVGDLRKATEFFRIASKQYPELHQAIGDFETRMGKSEAASASYERAGNYLASKVSDNVNDPAVKVDYATVLMKLGKFGDAEAMLMSGKNRKDRVVPNDSDDNSGDDPQDDIQWDKLLSSLYVNYHDVISLRGGEIGGLLDKLEKALKHDPNSQAALQRLMAYSRASVDGNVGLKRILARVIAQGESPAMAHLAMGNLCSMEGETDQAKFHFERALSIESHLAVVMNNMAWLLAHEDEPDYPQALSLIERALAERPEDPSFLDTRGTIYFLKKDYQKALTDLERALKGIKAKQEVHRKLAVIYRELGIPEIAQEHRLLSESTEAP